MVERYLRWHFEEVLHFITSLISPLNSKMNSKMLSVCDLVFRGQLSSSYCSCDT